MRRKGARTNYPRLRGASSAARRLWEFGHFRAISLHWKRGLVGTIGVLVGTVDNVQGTCVSNRAVCRGTRTGEPCNEHPCLLSLHACEPRARQSRTQPSFRSTHRGGAVPPTGPPRPRRIEFDQATVPITPGRPPEGSTIHRTGRARRTTQQVVSQLGTTAGKRLEAGAGESGGPHRASDIRGAVGASRERHPRRRFSNIGRVVLCTRAGESTRKRPIRRGWPPIVI